jgi:hypothetical protein
MFYIKLQSSEEHEKCSIHILTPDGAIRSNDYHVLPATEKQILFAQKIAKVQTLPWSTHYGPPKDFPMDRYA